MALKLALLFELPVEASFSPEPLTPMSKRLYLGTGAETEVMRAESKNNLNG